MTAPLVLSALLVTSAGLSAERTEAPYFAIAGDAPEHAMALRAVSADVDVAGVIARVTLRQRWSHDGAAAIDGTYVFPGSTGAAVHGLRMQVGERVVRAVIDERERARATFAAAQRSGHTASLLTQKRPNVFQMDLANIPPGEDVVVELTYTELLSPEDGVYSLVIPQAVGPRYSGEKRDGTDAVQLPIADGAPSFEVTAQLALPVAPRGLGSPSHAVHVTRQKGGRATVTGEGGDDGPPRDWVLRWRLAGERVHSGVLLFRDRHRRKAEREHFFAAIIEPPAEVAAADMPPREVIFVLDVSGSMAGLGLDTARDLMTSLLRTLRAQDRFNVILFSSGSHMLSPMGSVPATAENRRRALEVLSWQQGGGGTAIDEAVHRAVTLPPTEQAGGRAIVVITDGWVSFEKDVFRGVRRDIGTAKLFAFGVGPSVNGYLIEGLARAGRGADAVVLDAAGADDAAARFVRRLGGLSLADVEVTFDGLDVYDVEAAPLGHLYADMPLVVLGKYRGPAAGDVVVRGRTAAGPFIQRVEISDHLEHNGHAPLRELWARRRVRERIDYDDETPAIKAQVTALGLRYGLLTPYTSFVAVDDDRTHARAGAPAKAAPSAAGKKRISLDEMAIEGKVDGPADVMVVPSRSTFRKKTVIDFSGEDIGGDLAKPAGSYVRSRARTEFRSVIPVRESFSGEMLDDAGVFGGGGLGLSGVGRGGGGGAGYGSGSGSLGVSSGGSAGYSIVGRGAVARGAVARGAVARGAVGGGAGAAPIAPAPVVVRGSMSKELVSRVMRRARAQVRFCYEKQLAKDPSLAGAVKLSWTIDKLGRATDAKVAENTTGSEEVAACVLRVTRKLKFPRPAGGGSVQVTYPFVFAPAEDE